MSELPRMKRKVAVQLIKDKRSSPDTLRAAGKALIAHYRELEKRLDAARKLIPMARKWAEGGGKDGPEMREYQAIIEVIAGEGELENG